MNLNFVHIIQQVTSNLMRSRLIKTIEILIYQKKK